MTRGLKLRQAGGSIRATLPRDMAERLHLAAGDTALALAGTVAGRYCSALRELAK